MRLKLELLHEEGGLQSWAADLGEMPIASEDRPLLAEFLLRLLHAGEDAFGLTLSVWIEATHLHLEAGTRMLAPHASVWVPKIGLGLHPDGELPRLWTEEDFAEAPWGHKPPVFNNQVWEVSRASGHESAIRAMAGRGALSLLLMDGSAAEFKGQMGEVLGPLVVERAYQMYPFYFPLLTEVSGANAVQGGWLGNARVYVREVFESRALVMFSRVPLETCLAGLGGISLRQAEWEFDLAGRTML